MPTNPYPVGKAARNAEPTLPRAVLQGLQQKQQIIAAVIEGHIPLWEAGSRFQAAHRAASQCLESATGVPSRTIDNESACRALIGWVCLALSDRPERADRVAELLEGELREHINRRAGVPAAPC